MLRLIAEDQVLTYDYRLRGDYENYWRQHGDYIPTFLRCLASIGDRPWRFLDLGGGTGCVTDFILNRFPHASGVVMDASSRAITGNAAHPRKTCICDSADHVDRYGHDGPFDLILMHDFLHHLVTGRYRSSGTTLAGVLRRVKFLLASGGYISILEECYDGWIDNLPGRMIFTATSSRLLAPVARRLGAATAGVGVRFQSVRGWQRMLAATGFVVEDQTTVETFRWRPLHTLLGLWLGRTVHFWCH